MTMLFHAIILGTCAFLILGIGYFFYLQVKELIPQEEAEFLLSQNCCVSTENDLYENAIKLAETLLDDLAIKGRHDSLLKTIYNNQKQKNDRWGIRLIFLYVNKLLCKQQFQTVDELLQQVNPNEIATVGHLLAFLTITRAAREHLPYREILKQKTYNRITQLKNKKLADLLLKELLLKER